MNSLIIDPDSKVLNAASEYIRQSSGVYLFGSIKKIKDAEKIIEDVKPDLLIIDINLPEALEFIRFIEPRCAIFTSSNGDLALSSYDLNAVDYLIKPLSKSRFLLAIEKAKLRLNYLRTLQTEEQLKDHFFVRTEYKFEKINKSEILYMEDLQGSTLIQTETQKVIAHSSFRNIESYLPENEFLRVQKSFIVPVSKISRIEGDTLIISEKKITIHPLIKDQVLKIILNTYFYKFQA